MSFIYLFFCTITAPSSPAASRVRFSSLSSLLGNVVISTYGWIAGRDLHSVRVDGNRYSGLVRIDECADVGDGLVVIELRYKPTQ